MQFDFKKIYWGEHQYHQSLLKVVFQAPTMK